MLSILKHKLVKNTLAYTLSASATKLIAFLMLPILTRYLTPSDYGIVATFQIILSVMMVLVTFNTPDAILVNYFKIGKKRMGVYVGNIFFVLFTNFILTISIIYFLKGSFSHLLKFPESWLITIAIIALSQTIITIALILWQMERKPLPYGMFNILQAITTISLSLYFIIILGLQWQGRLLGIIIASIIFGIIALYSIYKRGYLKFSFNKNYIKNALFIGVPLIPHALGGLIRTGIDKIFINSMVNVGATGIYTVGYQVGMIIGVLGSSFNVAWAPFLFSRLKEDNYQTKIKIVKLIYIYSIFIIGLALCLGIIAPSFLKFFIGIIVMELPIMISQIYHFLSV